MLIQMICGTFGVREGESVVAKTSRSAPFEVGEEKGKQLILMGYAREVREHEALPLQVHEKDSQSQSLEDYSIQDLRRMAKGMGLSASGTKKQLIERIQGSDKAPYESQETMAQPNEEPPTLSPAEPEA